VQTEGNVVTAKGSGFFFIQSPAGQTDNNPATSDALLVNTHYFGSIGDLVDVSGLIIENDGNTSIGGSGMEVTTAGENAPLPPAVVLDETLPSGQPSTPHSLEPIENMRIQYLATVVSPSDESELVALTAGTSRPLREPGILYPGLAGLPVWDGNPELFWMDPNALNAPNNRFLNTGDQIEADAVIVEADIGEWLALPRTYTVLPAPDLTPVPPRQPGEITIGSLNLFFLTSGAWNLSTRMDKLALYIQEQMRLPDILAVQEVGNLTLLQDLSYKIELLVPGTNYQAFLLPGNDDINLGFLVKSYLQDCTVSQLGKDEIFMLGGPLHDRPPLLLNANLPTNPPTPVQVLNLHMRSLIGIEGSNSFFVRNKRHEQGISVAEMIQQLQSSGNLFILGDFNAFQFSDGYVDLYSQLCGTPTLGAQYSPLSIVSPSLSEPLETLPEQDRYSYVFRGNAQVLDHCLAGSLNGLEITRMAYARGNADYALAYEDNPFVPQSCSDHDGLLVYVQTDNPLTAIVEAGETAPLIQVEVPNPARPGEQVSIRSLSGGLEKASIYDPLGRLLWQKPLAGQLQSDFHLPLTLSGGSNYLLLVESENASSRDWIFIYE